MITIRNIQNTIKKTKSQLKIISSCLNPCKIHYSPMFLYLIVFNLGKYFKKYYKHF